MKRLLVSIMFSLSFLVAFAQKEYEDKDFENGVFVKIMPDGTDSIFTQFKLYKGGNAFEKQYNLIYKDDDGNINVLKPQDVRAYHIAHGKKYISTDYIKDDGSVEKLFVVRTAYGDSIRPSLYKVYISPKKYKMYMCVADNPMELISKADDPSYGNKLVDYLLKLNSKNGDNEYIAENIKKVKPKQFSILNRLKVVKSQNINMLPVFQWGVGTGVNVNMLSLENVENKFSVGNQVQWQAAHCFVNYRAFGGFGFHSELSFMKASCMLTGEEMHIKNTSSILFATYNKTAIVLPIMFRYTFDRIRGKWLPFVEGGIQLRYDFRDNCDESHYINSEEIDNIVFTKRSYSYNTLPLSLTGGLGMEYRLTPKHSLFLEGRYCHQLSDRPEDNYFLMRVNSFMFNLSFSL